MTPENQNAATIAENGELRSTPKTVMTPKAANVRLAKNADALGIGAVTVGNRVIAVLPHPAKQRAGFYCENAAELIALYRGRFKFLKNFKG